jgi:hypothetical protein
MQLTQAPRFGKKIDKENADADFRPPSRRDGSHSAPRTHNAEHESESSKFRKQRSHMVHETNTVEKEHTDTYANGDGHRN